MSVKMPGLLEHWSVDELAECLDDVGKELYAKLWSYIPEKGDGPKGAEVWNELTVSIPVPRRFPKASVNHRCAQVTVGESRDWGGGDILPAGVSSEGDYVKATEI